MIITAQEGKVFRRKSDGFIYGDTVNLGYTYYIGGVKLDAPHLEVPEDFEEIYKPTYEKEVTDNAVYTNLFILK